MARDFNENRNVNAILGRVSLNRFGRVFAAEYNLDGFSIVDIQANQAPTDIKDYLEGDTDITIYPVADNVSKLCAYALASFPSITTIYLFKYDNIVNLQDDLSYLTHLAKIYVQPSLLDTYKSTYTSIASLFDTWVTEYTLTIPYDSEHNILTVAYSNTIINGLTSIQKNAYTQVIVPSGFVDDEVGALDFIFNETLPNARTIDLNNNILPLSSAYLVSQNGIVLEVE